MCVLTGAYNHSVDAKNRIRIPSKLRADMGIAPVETENKEEKKFSLVFHTGTDGCIEVYTQEAVDKIFSKFADVKQSDFEMTRAVRKFLSTFETVESDPQGRLVIPPMYRNHAKIKKDIVICGTVNRVEIWAKEVYDEYIGVDTMTVEDVNELVKKLGI